MADAETRSLHVQLDAETYEILSSVAELQDRTRSRQAARVLRRWAQRVHEAGEIDPTTAVDVNLDELP